MNTIKRLNVSVGHGLIYFAMIFSFLFSAPASAALLQFSFAGAVSDVNSQLFPTINTGQTLSGSFTVNSGISNTGSGTTQQYTNAFTNLTLNLGPANATPVVNAALVFSPDNSLTITTGGTLDLYAAQGPLTGSAVNGLTPIRFEFDGGALPSTPPSLSSFAYNHWRLIFSGTGSPTVSGSFSSLTAVPLPAAVILFGAGLVALAGLGAGRRRQRRIHTA